MREVIAVCRSRKKARDNVARTLDRYFWRIGDRTWRGRASNACLDRVARELRAQASRATAVSIQEVRSSHESRLPLIRIGSRIAFSDEGLAPVASHPAQVGRIAGTACERHCLAIVRIAALFHDLGKATVMFQEKLRRSMKGGSPEADAIRHEMVSAVVWEELFGSCSDREITAALSRLSGDDVDTAWNRMIGRVAKWNLEKPFRVDFDFFKHQGSVVFAVGALILTHHRLPGGGGRSHTEVTTGEHTRASAGFGRSQLEVELGVPFWHEEWWLRRLRRDASLLVPGAGAAGLDIALRASLMFADHYASAMKQASDTASHHLANTKRPDQGETRSLPADSLSDHVRKVYSYCRSSFDMLHRLRDRLPALGGDAVPSGVLHPPADTARFRWQADAASAASRIASSREGGFFACVLAGTGAGKTRGAPAILAAAALSDARPERRYFRMTLGLGLRVLASQSAREYVDALGFSPEDVSVLIGQMPIEFNEKSSANEADGSESLDLVPASLDVEPVRSTVPGYDDEREADWLRSLSLDTDRMLPAFLELVASHSQKGGRVLRELARAPVLVATIDYLMPVASPLKSAYLPASIRVLSSDLILDEIDQYGAEDIAAIARLVYQAAAGGRRVIAMSATLTADVAVALHDAYVAGWKEYARARGIDEHVHTLCTGDADGSCTTNAGGEAFGDVYRTCRDRILDGLRKSPTVRRGQILPPAESWEDLVSQIDESCSRMHEAHAVEINGFRVSIGLVRMSRISHTSAVAMQLQAGNIGGRLRVKLCLHSNFPRLYREWIEMRLKHVLTRKGADPDSGLLAMCRREGLFERAERVGARDIEIVAVTSPVIETGNDLDFDYAIVDPASMRSIVQAAGRVRRHRLGQPPDFNILILGKSPIVMEMGVLAMPGVETPLNDKTGVDRVRLDQIPDRAFRSLAGGIDLDVVTAASVLSDEMGPLKAAEQLLRERMLSTLPGNDVPLGCYLGDPIARLNRRFAESRRFRRSTSKSVRVLAIPSSDDIVWMIDVDPGVKGSRLHHLNPSKMDINPEYVLFPDIKSAALNDGPGEDTRHLLATDIPIYGDDLGDKIPHLAYTDLTGFTRGNAEDLKKPFGKSQNNT